MTDGNASEFDHPSWANIRAPEPCRPRHPRECSQQSDSYAPINASPGRTPTWQNPPYSDADNAVNRQETIMAARPQAVATIKIEEPHVRVTEFRFAPGAETGWHRHEYDYVVVP